MTVVTLWIFRILIGMFLVGMIGSIAIVCITTVQDLFVLFEKDDKAPGVGAPAPQATQQQSTAQ